jgi:hypothetical protein
MIKPTLSIVQQILISVRPIFVLARHLSDSVCRPPLQCYEFCEIEYSVY